ncbi:MAG: IreB family regulatory phosphoprotein [Ruminococcaceae bacterium]|nr:IreB family regulatory phosphoprotein [Oscillospiraceae bacterium]
MKDEMSKTITFSIREEERDKERKLLLRTVYDALSEKGYNPINQLVGYVLTEDPTYITNYKNARGLIRRIDRDELMAALLKEYLEL